MNTQGVKYAGSKQKLIPYILKEVEMLKDVRTVIDGFAGTTRVSQAFHTLGYEVTSNDVSAWSEVFGKCYLLADRPKRYYQEMIDFLNSLEGKDGWFTENYGGDEADEKRPFQKKNTRRLDAIREEIDRMGVDDIDKSVLLTSLILALDSVDSTLGHHVSYLSKWAPRAYNDMKLEVPRLILPKKAKAHILRGDVFDAIRERSFDFAYFDPPYGSNNEKMPPSRVRYSSYYHLWTTVVKNDRPSVFGKANRREDTRDEVATSVFEEFRKDSSGRHIAMNAIERLVRYTDARYIMLSYSSGGRATKQELIDILNDSGKLLRTVEIDYKKNVMAQMKWTNDWAAKDDKNKEYLFLLDKS